MHLPADPVSVGAARGLVRMLHHWLTDEQVGRCELVVSELVTNAIRHGTLTADDLVVLEVDVVPGSVHACVRDHGPAFGPAAGWPHPGQSGGFGLKIVEQLSTGLRVEHSASGNTVSFSI